MKEYGEVDSKFRFIIIAAKRAKQLLHGDKPKLKSNAKNPIRIAQEEVRSGLIEYEIIELPKEEIFIPEDEGFIGEEIGVEGEEVEEKAVKKGKGKKKSVKKVDKKAEEKVAKKAEKKVDKKAEEKVDKKTKEKAKKKT